MRSSAWRMGTFLAKLNTRQSALRMNPLYPLGYVPWRPMKYFQWGLERLIMLKSDCRHLDGGETVPVSQPWHRLCTQNRVIPNRWLRNSVVSRHSPILNHDRIFWGEFAQIWQIRGTLSQDSASPPVYQARRGTWGQFGCRWAAKAFKP